MKRDIFEAVRLARVEQRPTALLTNLTSGDQKFLQQSEIKSLNSEIRSAVDTALRADRSTLIDTDEGPVFVHVFNSPLRMIVVGAVHIAQALAPIAGLAGYDVTIVDPRRSFASDSRFPDLKIDTSWPDDAMTAMAPDSRTAVVALSHDPKLDDPALSVALASQCFYIGALGSSRTQAARRKRLAEAGFSESDLARIHGPIGLDISAKSPAEIAIAIMAEVTRVLRSMPAS